MMKNTLRTLMVFAAITLSLASCQEHESDKLIGKWRIVKIAFQQFTQQLEMSQKQVVMLQDSIAANSADTAKVNHFQKLLAMTQGRADQMKAQQDTMMAKSRWEFLKNGDFNAIEAQGNSKGIWSYDEEKGMLFTVIDQRTYSQKVKFNKDTMILQLDSLNYMGFLKAND